LVGTIAPYDVYVAVLDKRDPLGIDQEAPVWDSLQARADGFYAPVYNTNNSFYWNGNDVVILAKGTLSTDATADVTTAIGFAIVDIFGKIGENPGNGTDPLTGWTCTFPYFQSGDGATVDHSMIRKNSILKGVKTQVSFFDPLLEWDTIPAVVVRLDPITQDTVFGTSGNPVLDGNWFSLGTHDCACAPAAVETIKQAPELSVFPNPTTGMVYIKGASQIEEISVYNSLGQLVERVSNNSKSVLSMDLGPLKGLYILKMTEELFGTFNNQENIKETLTALRNMLTILDNIVDLKSESLIKNIQFILKTIYELGNRTYSDFSSIKELSSLVRNNLIVFYNGIQLYLNRPIKTAEFISNPSK
jgi:hypothetical protein